ncbi:MAG: RHS repeat-associated core domain-containing protein [Lewinellaceae bacterium]|nr:RHS repeat-associated core domain-containing protein [Lewinellaceae bacterium]
MVAEYSGGQITRYRAEYFHQDHLGNTRLVFSDFNQNGLIELTEEDPTTAINELEITQEAHYYPFGMNHLGSWYETVAPENKYLYNGKELNGDYEINLMDYGARWYDGAIGRWTAVDPLAEERSWVSPYNYVQNNPILRIDPDGALDSPIFGRDGKFLGTDSKGFEGDIVIMDEDKYNLLTKNGEETLDHGQVMKWAEFSPHAQTLDDYVANDFDLSKSKDREFLIVTDCVAAFGDPRPDIGRP